MYPSNAYPSFLSTIHQEHPQSGTNVDAQTMGRYMNSPTAVNIYGWIRDMRPQSSSDLAMSYSSGGQPPSFGDMRQMAVSEPSGCNQMYNDGKPPSVNDVCRGEASQSEASCNRYESPDDHEVQQLITYAFLNAGVWPPPPQPLQRMPTFIKVYKSGVISRSIDISAYSGYNDLKQDLARRFGIEGQLEDGQRIGWKLVYVGS